MGSPTSSTLARAIANGWVQFPGITAAMVRNQPNSEGSSRGHLDRTRAGLDSTRRTPQITSVERQTPQTTNEPKFTVYVDLTGRFPHVSARGVEYMMCCRCSDSNYIHLEPLRSRNSKEITSAFERTIKIVGDRGVHHRAARMDNEVSNFFKETVRSMGIRLELVPPDNHRHHHVCGDYDFSRNPIAPLGTRVIILEDPNKRGSWASHGVRGFYVGPALDHYRSFRVLIDDTKRVRIRLHLK
jgi:hypothetical protein